jgi:nicotinamidase-related amidase
MIAYDSPGLVISECQCGVLDPDLAVFPALAEEAARRGLLARIQDVAHAFRSAGLPVFQCLIEHRPDMAGMIPNSLPGALAIKHRRMLAGTPDVAVPPPLSVAPSDIVSSRATGLTAFYGTDLDAMLRLHGVRTLVLTGVSTDMALPGLALEAVNRGYYVVIPEDCTAGTPGAHRFMIDGLLSAVARITTAEQVIARIPGGGDTADR